MFVILKEHVTSVALLIKSLLIAFVKNKIYQALATQTMLVGRIDSLLVFGLFMGFVDRRI